MMILALCLAPSLLLAIPLAAATPPAGPPLVEESFESRAALAARGAAVAPGIEFRPGKAGQAAWVRGTQAIRLPLDIPRPTEETIEFWEAIEWPADGPGFRCGAHVLELGTRRADGSRRRIIVAHVGALYGATRELGAHVYADASNAPPVRTLLLTGNALDWINSRWYHVCLVRSRASDGQAAAWSLYLDGVLQDHGRDVGGAPDERFEYLLVGGSGDPAWFAIDSLAIWPVARSFSPSDGNRAPNYSFEHDVNADGCPDFWSQFGPPGVGYWGGLPGLAPAARGRNQRTGEDAYSGAYAARMDGLAPGVGGQICCDLRGLEPGALYEIDAAVNASQPSVRFFLLPYDETDTPLADHKATFDLRVPPEHLHDWVLLSEIAADPLRFRAPAGCRYARLYLLIADRQTLWWDDVFVTPVARDHGGPAHETPP